MESSNDHDGLLSIGIIQMEVDPINKEVNLSKMEKLFTELVNGFPYVDVVLFGELYVHGSSKDSFEKNPESFPGPSSDRFCELAKKTKKWLCPGTQWEKTMGKYYNISYLINPEGQIVLEYRKMRPWKPYEPTNPYPANFPVYEIPGKGKLGILICYDILFPEMARALALQGVEVILHPTLHMDPLQPQFYISERAAAVHNQCYLVSCCGCGLHAGYSLAGHSAFIHPEGNVLWEAGKSEAMTVKVLDLNVVRNIRKSGTENLMPLLKHLYYFNWQFSRTVNTRDMPLYDELSLEPDEMKDCT